VHDERGDVERWSERPAGLVREIEIDEDDADRFELRVVELIPIDGGTDTERLTGVAWMYKIEIERLALEGEARLTARLREFVRDACAGLDACQKHPDCRTCPDVGRVCLLHRRNGIRSLSARCA
jgi:hypothetical protein